MKKLNIWRVQSRTKTPFITLTKQSYARDLLTWKDFISVQFYIHLVRVRRRGTASEHTSENRKISIDVLEKHFADCAWNPVGSGTFGSCSSIIATVKYVDFSSSTGKYITSVSVIWMLFQPSVLLLDQHLDKCIWSQNVQDCFSFLKSTSSNQHLTTIMCITFPLNTLQS